MRCLTPLLCIAICSAATATGFDGRSASGPLSGEAQAVLIGASRFALADLDRLVLGDGPAPHPEGTLGVLLADGSWLPASAITAAKRDAVLVDGPLGRLELPLTAISGWGSPEPPPAGGDDAVAVASGLLRGRVQGIADGVLAFAAAADPEPVALPLAQIRGLRLAQPARPPGGPRLRASLDPARPPLDLVLIAGRPALAAAPGVALDPAVFGGLALRIEGGRRAYLGDLPIAKAREDGAFGVVWPHSVDQAISGAPLLLGGSRYAKGLVVHSAAELAWDLAGDYLRMHATVGIADEVAPEGDCVARLVGDGRELWKARVRGTDAPHALDLDLAGCRQLVLVVELGERQDIGDHLVLADAQLIRR